MPTKAKIAPGGRNVLYNLRDIMEQVRAARRAYDVIEPIILARRDRRLTEQLLELRRAIDTIDRKARDATKGEYYPEAEGG